MEIKQREKELEVLFQKMTEIRNEAFNDDFLLALYNKQKEKDSEDNLVQLKIKWPHGLNDKPEITISIRTHDNYTSVLQKCATHLNLREDLIRYFGLFLVHNERNRIIRRFDKHDAPLLTLKSAQSEMNYSNNGTVSIHFRKSFWNKKYEDILRKDQLGDKLLFNQSFDDFKKTECYNYLLFKDCYLEFLEQPKKLHKIYVGAYEMKIISSLDHLRCTNPDSPIYKQGESHIDFTKIRSWKLSANETLGQENYQELAFEVLTSEEGYKWFTVLTLQAVFLCDCLRRMADELLEQKKESEIANTSNAINPAITEFGDNNI